MKAFNLKYLFYFTSCFTLMYGRVFLSSQLLVMGVQAYSTSSANLGCFKV